MQTERRVRLIDAFTDEPLAGNAAGVVPDADGLSGSQMQAIARELAVSETAFLLSPDAGEDAAGADGATASEAGAGAGAESTDDEPADHRIRYFTPTQEVDLCGHATVAAGAHLHADGIAGAGTHRLATNVGPIDVEIEPDGTVWMTQNRPEVREVTVEYDRLAEVLGIDPAALRDVGADAPPAVASTGLAWLLVPVNFLEHLGSVDPDVSAVEALADEHDAVGIYAFTFDTLDGDSTLHARAFAPGAGVPEDPVTGTASGACGAYLRHVGAVTDTTDMRFEQGHFLDRPGTVRVDVGAEVRAGGRAAVALDGTIRVPEDDEDEIIEA